MTRRRGRIAFSLAGKAGWALADQALSSLTNFALTFLAARSLGTHDFGGFGLAFAAYLLALGFARSVVAEPLVVRYSGTAGEEWRAAVQPAAGTAVVVGLVGGLALVVAGAGWGGPAGEALLAIGVFLPALLLQDTWRFAFFAAGRGRAAAANDAVWAVVLAAALGGVAARGRPGVATFALAWAVAGAAAGLVGAAQARALPRPSGALAWLASHRDLVSRFSAQFVVQTGASQLALYLIAALAGLSAVGGIRAAQVLLGPLNVLFMGTALFAVPEAARQYRGGSVSAVGRAGVWVSSGLALAAAGWALAVALLPDRLGVLILRDNWYAGRSFLAPVGLWMVAAGASAGAATVLRGLADARRSLRGAAFQSVLLLAAIGVGALLAGGQGAAWAGAFAACVTSVAWWTLARWGLREASARASRSGIHGELLGVGGR